MSKRSAARFPSFEMEVVCSLAREQRKCNGVTGAIYNYKEVIPYLVDLDDIRH